jgi:hypothetical protein
MGKSAWYQVDTSRVYAASPAPPKEPTPLTVALHAR